MQFRSSIPLRTILSIFCQSIFALQHCHHPVDGRTIIIHRDIKPENSASHCETLTSDMLSNLIVLLMANGTVKLADFGLSKTLQVSQAVAQSFVGVSLLCQLMH